jgi:hypothetical protein
MRGGDIWQFVVIWYSVALVLIVILFLLNWR